MRDIGEIDKKIDRVEYYTQLSLLETAIRHYKYKTQMVLTDLKMDLS